VIAIEPVLVIRESAIRLLGETPELRLGQA